jgi:hypothetical protein
METIFDFKDQLKVGNKGESSFLSCYESLGAKKSQNREYDFYLTSGEHKDAKVELKTDTYDMKDTRNFFMEILGSTADGKLGGPWRAMQDGVDFFVYYYIRNGTFFWFRTDALCYFLDDLVASGHLLPREIKNKGWVTRGYIVPRDKLETIQFRMDTF